MESLTDKEITTNIVTSSLASRFHQWDYWQLIDIQNSLLLELYIKQNSQILLKKTNIEHSSETTNKLINLFNSKCQIEVKNVNQYKPKQIISKYKGRYIFTDNLLK